MRVGIEVSASMCEHPPPSTVSLRFLSGNSPNASSRVCGGEGILHPVWWYPWHTLRAIVRCVQSKKIIHLPI